MADCLTDEQLEQLAAGQLSELDAAPLRSHVEECLTCQKLLAEWKQNLSFADAVKGAVVGSAGSQSMMQQYLDNTQSAGHMADSITGYEIMYELHRGTQGVVYQAIQEDTGRQVAIKFLREGVHASRASRKRFEREIELAAGLKHPNIIKVFESGVSSAGHHYYVMDYVHGLPMHQYVWQKRLPLEAALTLFATVCDAVNFAHQRGVIHRDLKPSNILVDADGVPHVLDFGLAKPLSDKAEASGTWASMAGEVVGTLPYMSPEQAEGVGEMIDIRTDVYSLGIILYMMLTGDYPYPVAGSIAEVLNHIAETEPVSPSRMWSSKSGGVRTSSRVSAQSGVCPIDDDLETIILRALSKDPARRYQNVVMLTEDVRRYLVGQPIEAKRDAGLHVLRRSLARYKVAVALTAASVVLVAAFALMIWGMYSNSVLDRERAETERIRAVQAQGRLAQVLLRLGDVSIERGDYDEARAQYQAALALNQHLAAVSLDNVRYQANLADVYMRIGNAALRANDLERAVEYHSRFNHTMMQLSRAMPKHRGYQDRLALSYEQLARVQIRMGNDETARQAAIEALRIRRTLAMGATSSVASLNAYAQLLLNCEPADLQDPQEALAVAHKAVVLSGEKDVESLAVLALAYDRTGDTDRAMAVRRQALKLLPAADSALKRQLQVQLGESGSAESQPAGDGQGREPVSVDPSGIDEGASE